MMNLKALKEQALQNPEVKVEYERLAPEFALASTLISMRQPALSDHPISALVNEAGFSLRARHSLNLVSKQSSATLLCMLV